MNCRITALTICLLGALLVGGCGATVRSSLRDAAESGDVPAQLQVAYDDHSARFGGERFEVGPDGAFLLIRYRPSMGGDEAVAEAVDGQVPTERMSDLVNLLVEVEAWRHEEPEATPINETRAVLEISVNGKRSRAWEWTDDLDANQRLVRVERLLASIAAELAPPTSGGEQPTDEGDGGDEVEDTRAVEGVAPIRITDDSRPNSAR